MGGKVIIVKCVPKDAQNDGCVVDEERDDTTFEDGGGLTKDEFKRLWTETTEMIKQIDRDKKELEKRSFLIARGDMKPDMLKTASGVTYRGNGKVVKYV